MSTRLDVNVTNATAADLRGLASRRGVTVTEVVRRAVATLAFLEQAQAEGQQIRTVDRSGAVTNVRILP